MERRLAAREQADKRQLPTLPGLPAGATPMSLTPMNIVDPADSVLLETVFASVEAIKEPGSVTQTSPLIMSELVNHLIAGGFQA